MSNDEEFLVNQIENIDRICWSSASWQLKYDRCFHIFNEQVNPMIKKFGLTFEYYDSDMDYENDLMELTRALTVLKEDFIKSCV